MMHFIKHIIEPTKLLLAWQSLDESQRTRHIVAELNLTENGVNLIYLTHTKDFLDAQKKGFESYNSYCLSYDHYFNIVER